MKLMNILVYFSLLFMGLSCNEESTTIPQEPYLEKYYIESGNVIMNPERGFYTYREFVSGKATPLTAEAVKGIYNEGYSLIYTVYYMPDFTDKLISNDYLQVIKANMEALRAGGCKSVLRFAYSYDQKHTPSDAPWDWTKQHIAQLKPILQEYVDVIYVLQAGLVGTWGEWYYTDNYIFEPKTEEDFIPRKNVIDALLDALPQERMIGIRTPGAKIKSYNLTVADTVTVSTAFNGSKMSRLGGHNDCFLADNDDRGTYNGANREYKRFWQNETRYLAMGGETCQPSSYSECYNALEEFERYHWSYINMDYHASVINDWLVNGCINEIKKRLGYRLVLLSGKYTNEAGAGDAFEINLKLKNMGWASPVNPRNVEVIFISKTDNKERYKVAVDTDPRLWYPKEIQELNIKLGIPSNIKQGEYDIYLNLPDPKSTLSENKEFSIQLANTDMWDSSTGYNKLHTVKVSGSKGNAYSNDVLKAF
ncbi:uncharacterized protein DUF4874 [Dysgonomonas alginatilytica]|uniref:Uncharacterized protein DUF4874 n=1 Tax=Dysgonomonas alginatilytica TaxID=1605892 RepID=A0A2V3PPS5_9BACT|nr:DUF4832 domain-containing protein [Dysgonomonas alginatilytica]PXV63561.1 uncharacterized protein DUF4874 [Dysgonomonas alginatilytica]